jgi:long-chain acyl-CoA synthetase
MAARTSFRSVPEMWLHRISSTPDSDAFQYPTAGGWKTMPWKEAGARARAIAAGLLALGLRREERCAILSMTRVEWILADMAILLAGGATTTIYPSNTPDECRFIVSDSGTRFVFCEDAEQVAKLARVRAQIPGVEKVIVTTGKGGHDGWVITLDELERIGRAWDKENKAKLDDVARSVESHHLATLIYTSGTTGEPKGVELTHDCWVFEAEAMDSLGILSPADKQFLFLPLAHSFAKVLELASIRVGMPSVVDGRIDTLVQSLGETNPTVMAAVPRIFEKVYNKFVAGAKEGGRARFRIFQWAIGVGREVSALRQKQSAGGPAGKKTEPSGVLAFQHALADRLVYSKLKARFGGRMRFFISGGAPLSRDMAEFFHAADVLVLEGYGLTESSAASFVNRPGDFRFGTVGKPLPGVEVKIAEEDGEVLLKGRGIMRGYHDRPEETRAVLTPVTTMQKPPNGTAWLHTGDIGTIDADGFLKITDRKKDLIKTSGGKYVAPQMLENKLKALCPYVSQVLVHGDNRNYCTALIALNEESVREWGKDRGLGGASYADLARDERVHALFQPFVDELNAGLASYETIKRWVLLPVDLTVENGFLTPTLKVKRKKVEAEFQDLLDGFYAGAVQAI